MSNLKKRALGHPKKSIIVLFHFTMKEEIEKIRDSPLHVVQGDLKAKNSDSKKKGRKGDLLNNNTQVSVGNTLFILLT
jgi:hypothetical protein